MAWLDFLRSALFLGISYVSIVLYIPVLIVGWLLPRRRRYYVLFSYGFVVFWLARIITGLRWEVEGREHLQGPPGRLIAAKHQSTWDTMILPVLLHQPAFVLKKELLWIPIFGTGLAGMGPIAIDRKAGRQALKQILTQGKVALAEGRDVVIFPEGTRHRPDVVAEYKPGVALLAREAKTPIIPVALNSGCFWRKKQFLKRPGTIRLVIGSPIPTEGKRPEQITREVRDWIETEQRRLYQQYGCPGAPDAARIHTESGSGAAVGKP
ncbi:lysophospholipid acyltransferase family protein [Halothiobacillus sp. DCM-1]|uniref:lysophospholipid acyltransferase family protein n=1 Tax=Halothiobacillus sp. DCM-1 TaxID=3112558 RepID=UPI003245CCBF